MTLENKNVECEVKFAHGEGHTVFALSEDGHRLLTGGIDGEARSWSLKKGEEDEEPESFDVGSAIYSIEILKDKFYICSESIDVKTFQLDDGSYLGRLIRFSSFPYCMSISSDKKSIAIGSGDFVVKIIDIESSSIVELDGHDAPVLSVAFDPKCKFLVSSGCDGQVIIWDLKTREPVHKLTNVCEKSNDFINSKTLCQTSWNASGSWLAIPFNNEIRLLSRDNWNVDFTLTVAGLTDLSICAFDPSNKYLAVGTTSGYLVVWNLVDKSEPAAIYSDEKRSAITCIRFNSHLERQLIASDKSGQLLLIQLKDVKNSFQSKSVETPAFIDNDDDRFALLDDEDLEETFFKEQEQAQKASKIVSKEAKESQEDNSEDAFTAIRRKTVAIKETSVENFGDLSLDVFNDDGEDDDDDDDLIDIGAIKAKYESKIFQEGKEETLDTKLETKVKESIEEDVKKVINITVKPIIQSPFQPGSTPVEHPERYMVLNGVGMVRSHRNDDQQDSSIDVEFHDSTIYRPIHLANVHGFTMADLSSDALLLASPESIVDEDSTSDNETIASQLFCLHFASWDSNKEWRFDMPTGESIEAICLSSHYVIAVTNRRNARLFTLSGIQLHVFPLPGPVVCLAAQDNQLMIIFHNGSGLPGEQSLSMFLCNLLSKSLMPIVQKQMHSIPMALGAKCILNWAGFTDEGSPCTLDSQYVVRLYSQSSNCWIPIVDLQSKHKSDTFFLVSISEIQEQIRCISCKGAKYPAMFPKPTFINLPFEIPLCEMSNTKSKLEEQLIRLNLRTALLEELLEKGFDVDFSIKENSKKLIEILIRLFAVAINANSSALAIEIAYLMPNEDALEGAIRFASQKRKQVIVNKLNQILKEKVGGRVRAGEKEDDDDDEKEEQEESSSSLLSRKRMLNKSSSKRPKGSTGVQQEEEEEDILRPKQIKLVSNGNPFKRM